ncbi:MAG: tol-pal system-associated acyl-CoA thioesterase [Lysobacteraceae bacterium]|nr:MAG: tol-pal system-associated acyl-CoA thioesterase [Xanthomonadaceae bacterium]
MSGEAGEFSWPIRVYYEDTDAGGVVYHASYLHFLERARTEWLRALVGNQQLIRDTYGVVFVIRHISVRFKSPARLDEELTVTASPVTIGRAGFTMAQTIVRSDELLLEADVSAACVRATDFRPVRMPESVATALRQQ